MKSYRIVFTRDAEDDLDSIIEYIAADNPVRAISFVQELKDSCENTLSLVPKAGSKFMNSRYFAFGDYIVVYDVDDINDTIVVHMITHGSRQWRVLFSERLR